MPHLAAIGVVTADMASSCRFYALLGVEVGEPPEGEDHFEVTLPSGIRYALDLRDPSWDGVEERLAAAGAVRVGDVSGAAGWAYLRHRELLYSEDELDAITRELSELAGRGIETFAYFRHGDDPDAPAAALRVTGLGY